MTFSPEIEEVNMLHSEVQGGLEALLTIEQSATLRSTEIGIVLAQ